MRSYVGIHSDGGCGVARLGEPALEEFQTVVEQQPRARRSALWPVSRLRAPRAERAQHLCEDAVAPPVGDEL